VIGQFGHFLRSAQGRIVVRCSRALVIQIAICRISGSFMPRVVSAGVPMRMPTA